MNSLRVTWIAAFAAASSVLTGCDVRNDAIIFGQAQTVGISIGQSQSSPGPEFVLGYKDANVAVLPTAVTNAAGDLIILGGTTKAGDAQYAETFSVLGQFDVQATKNEQETGVKIGKFFSTGIAAQKLASGFACSISDGKDRTHCHPPK